MIEQLIEDSQFEQLKAWWHIYKHYVLTAVIALLLCYGGWEFYQRRQVNIANHASMLYDQILQGVINDDDTSIQAGSYRLLKDFPRTVYANLARLILAKSSLEQQQWEQAIEFLQEVATQAKDRGIQDIARLRLAKIFIQQDNRAEALMWLDAIEPDRYIQTKSLLKAQLYYRDNRYDEAKQMLTHALDADGMQAVIIRMIMADWGMLELGDALDLPAS